MSWRASLLVALAVGSLTAAALHSAFITAARTLDRASCATSAFGCGVKS